MKKQKCKPVHFSLIFLLSLSILSCGAIFQSPELKNAETLEEITGAGGGTVRLTIVKPRTDNSARTLYPDIPDFDEYRLSFFHIESNTLIKEETHLFERTEQHDTDGSRMIKNINLDYGSWRINVSGIVKSGINDLEIAVGVSKDPVIVNANKAAEATIVLESKTPAEGGMGIFTWDLTVLQGTPADSWVVTLSKWNSATATPITSSGSVNAVSGNTHIIGSFPSMDSGYYLLKASLSAGSVSTERQEIIFHDIVHILKDRTTTLKREVKPTDFMKVIFLSGTVMANNIYSNDILVPSSAIEIRGVWVCSSRGKRLAYADVTDTTNWKIAVLAMEQNTELHFRVVTKLFGDLPEDQQLELDLKADETAQVKDSNKNNILLSVGANLMTIKGTLTTHTSTFISNKGWEIKAYTDRQNLDVSNIVLNGSSSFVTGDNSIWTIYIDKDKFTTLDDIFFSVERNDQKNEKNESVKYKRVDLKASPALVLTAWFTPPEQVWIKGNFIGDGSSPKMLGDNRGRFTFTKNNIEDTTSYLLNLLAYFEGAVETPVWNQPNPTRVEYKYSDVVVTTNNLEDAPSAGTIGWYIGSIRDRPSNQNNVRITLDYTNDEYFEFDRPSLKVDLINEILVPAGIFKMGSPSTEEGRNGPSGLSSEIQHDVQLSAFYMMSNEITQEMYNRVMGSGQNIEFPKLPVANISWYQAVEFANKLSELDGFIPVYTVNGSSVTPNWDASGWRLPTEAEWEYACRAGTTTTYNTGSNISSYTGWYNANSGNITHEVRTIGSYNNWGLYDMHGNVWEMCWDWYGDYIIPNPPAIAQDPRGPNTGTSNISGTDEWAQNSSNQRIIRGGSYYTPPRYLRSAHRGVIKPTDNTYNDIGFRLVRKP